MGREVVPSSSQVVRLASWPLLGYLLQLHSLRSGCLLPWLLRLLLRLLPRLLLSWLLLLLLLICAVTVLWGSTIRCAILCSTRNQLV